MSVQKCVLTIDGKFVKVLEEGESAFNLYIVKTTPPKLTENQVAFWKNEKWVILRKAKFDDIEEYEKKLYAINNAVNMEKISTNLSEVYKTAPVIMERKQIPKRFIADKLEIERTKLTQKMINLFENNKRVTKKLKIYKKDLENKINELNADRKGVMPDVSVDDKGNIIIDDLIPSKVPF